MKSTIAVLALLALPLASLAGSKEGFTSPHISADCCDEPERWGPRHDARDARLAIHTEDKASTLILTSEVVAIQLSDNALKGLRREIKKEKDKDDEDNVLSQALKSAVLGSVRSMFDHSAECPMRELRSVDYRGGKLIFTTRKGKRVLDEIEVNDKDVMASFSERDAKAFVREFRRMKSRGD